MKKENKRYYSAGWKRFELNRRKMLANYDLAIFENKDRPLQTEHGLIAEANLRKWLEEFLPKRYGVTSGYIVPPIIGATDYKQYHYDVIIYDKLESPVVWSGENSDFSPQGQRKAIPASRVKAVFEVKASLTGTSAKDVIKKLNELSAIKKYLAKGFYTGAVFMELKTKNEKKIDFLQKLIHDNDSIGLNIGCILRSNCNTEISGFISSFSRRKQDAKDNELLYSEIDEYELLKNKEGEIIANEFSSVGIYNCKESESAGKQHFFKRYICSVGKEIIGDCPGLSIEWSRNGFTFFVLSILSRFTNGSNFKLESTGGYPFGLIFDEPD